MNVNQQMQVNIQHLDHLQTLGHVVLDISVQLAHHQQLKNLAQRVPIENLLGGHNHKTVLFAFQDIIALKQLAYQ
jgi:hypothetical protein